MEGSLFYYSKAVETAAQQLKPHSEESVTIEVGFDPTKGILKEYLDAEFDAIRYEYEKSGSTLPEWFDRSHFGKYCNSALQSRVAWVRNEMSDVIFRPEEKVLLPSLLDNVLKNIGQAFDTRLGIILMPTLASEKSKSDEAQASKQEGDSSSFEVLTRDECLKTSYFLQTISTYIGGFGYMKDKSGSFDFMTMQVLDDAVRNINDTAHPAYSILAAIVAPHWLQSAVQFSPRVKYGDIQFYKSLVWQLTSIG